jgi:AcrR family transcriptional regulator
LAAEAGVSLRLVQYYFESKARLIRRARGPRTPEPRTLGGAAGAPAARRAAVRRRPKPARRQLADVLRRAQAGGELAPDLDPSLEAARLLTINHGLGTSVLVGQRTAKAAMAVARYHLDELLRVRTEAKARTSRADARA